MLRFTTESGSLYEVIEDDHLVRRVSGLHDPTGYQGPDEVWRSYHAIASFGPSDPFNDDLINIGYSLIILWDLLGHTTMTSPVTLIEYTP